MTIIDLDFGGVGPIGLPDGTYTFVCDECEQIQKEGKDPYLNLKFSVADGQYQGQWVYHIASLGQKSRPYLKAMLEAMTGKSLDEFKGQINIKDLPGMTVRATVAQNSYTKQDGSIGTNAKIKAFLPKESQTLASAPTQTL